MMGLAEVWEGRAVGYCYFIVRNWTVLQERKKSRAGNSQGCDGIKRYFPVFTPSEAHR